MRSGPLGGGFAFLLVACGSCTAVATTLEVRAGAEIEVRIEESDVGPVLRGKVTTERGEPLGGARLSVEVNGLDIPNVVTDPLGEFHVRVDVGPAGASVEVALDESARTEALRIEDTLAPARAPVDLEIRAPARASLDEATLQLEIVATSPAEVRGESVSLHRDGRTLGVGFLDEAGRVLLRIGTDLAGPPGPAVLEARFAGDAVRAVATARAQILFVVTTRVEADASPRRVEQGGRTRVSGRALSAAGPVRGGAVSIRDGDRRLAIARTDGSGAFEVEVSLEGTPAGRLVLRAVYEPDAAYRQPSASAPIALRVIPPRTIPFLSVALPAALAIAISGWLLSRLRTPRRPRARPEPPAVIPAGAVLRRQVRRSGPPADVEITGRVFDPALRRSVAGAAIQIRTTAGMTETTAAEDGAFATGPLETGDVVLSFSSPGYEPGTLHARIPHAGELRDLRFHLVPIRQRLAEVYRDAVAAHAPDRPWGFATPRAIARAAARRLGVAWGPGQGVGPLWGLSDLFERGYYGRTEPELSDLRKARELAREVPEA